MRDLWMALLDPAVSLNQYLYYCTNEESKCARGREVRADGNEEDKEHKATCKRQGRFQAQELEPGNWVA